MTNTEFGRALDLLMLAVQENIASHAPERITSTRARVVQLRDAAFDAGYDEGVEEACRFILRSGSFVMSTDDREAVARVFRSVSRPRGSGAY